ncbi:MAG: peptidoglycan editing factor PgeF [Gammaproteobacteria bacterium]|nr:peptidoglycan editing factor PgeF [Gammaproteobacteria bacterium]
MARAPAPLDLIRPDWPAPPAVRAFATTRSGGCSEGTWAALNLGTHVGDDPAAVQDNRRRLRQALELPAEPLWLQQVHGTAVADADAAAFPATADAIVARRAGQACVVMTADCLPVLFCNDAGTRIAAAHAGWRGLAAGVLEATVAALVQDGAPAATLMAWIGPAISAPAYEVGAEVRAAILAVDPAADSAFTANARGRWQLDLVAIARRRLAAVGVPRVYGGNLCTASDPARFFSHRRDGNCGRQATLICIDAAADRRPAGG